MLPDAKREAALLQAAAQLSGESRVSFLEVACKDEPELRQRLETLLAAQEPKPSLVAESTSDATPTLKFGAAKETVGTIIGRYKILEEIGEGGCGIVYVAEQTEPVRRRVALKVIKLGMDTKAVVARFEAERQALAMMDHPNIAKVLDAGATETGRPYFVMELVRGVKITDYCDQHKLSTRQRLDLFVPVCQAIQHAHQKGIIHRDIKPSNILVTLHDGEPIPKVIDFGIAKATEGRLTDVTVYTQLHQFIGTPVYMSPEQAEMTSLDIDTRSDIYSLGVLLYELLTGKTPFEAEELMAVGLDGMRKTIREKEPVRPSTKLATLHGEELTTAAKRRSVDTSKLLHQLRGDLDWIVMKCLEKDRTRRYDTAIGLAADLKRHLNNEPVVARPPSTAYKFQKAFRRNKLAFGAAAAVLLALLLGLGVSIWQYVGKSRAELEQRRLRDQADKRAREASDAQAQAAQQRDLARGRLFDSYVREARSIRKARQVGYRNEAFARLKDALALGTAHADMGLLRKEAVACLGDWVGLDPIEIKISGRVFCDGLTADGTLVALGGRDGHVSLYQAGTGREVAAFNTTGVPLSVAFDLRGTALFLVVAEGNLEWRKRPQGVHLEKWSLRGDGTWRRDWSKPKTGAIGFSDTATGPVSFVLGANDAYLALEDPETNVELTRVALESPMPWLPITAIRPDRRQLALLSRDPQSSFDVQLEVWDLEAKQRVAQIRPRLGPGWGLSYGWAGRALAVTYDNTLVVYDTAHFGAFINMGGSFETTFGAAIGGSSDGLLAIPSMQEIGVRLTELNSGGEVAYLKLPTGPVSSRFSADGSVLLLSHNIGARVLHLKLAEEKLLLEGHQGGVPAVEFSPNGEELASAGKDRTLRLWNLSSGESRVLGLLKAPGQTLAYTPDGRHIICGYYDIGELSIWSVISGEQVSRIEPNQLHSSTSWSCAISQDGLHLAAIGGGLRVWDLPQLLQSSRTSQAPRQPLLVSTNGSCSVLFDAAGRSLFYEEVVGEDGVERAALFRQSLQPNATPDVIATNVQVNFVQTQCLLPKRGELAYVTRAREIAVLEAATGKVLRMFSTLEPGDPSWFVANLRASPDETRFALVTRSGLGVEIRDVLTGQLLYVLPEETGSIWWLAWSPDSQRLAITRANGQIAVWNLRAVDAQLAKLGLQP